MAEMTDNNVLAAEIQAMLEGFEAGDFSRRVSAPASNSILGPIADKLNTIASSLARRTQAISDDRESHYRIVVNTMNDGLVVFDASGSVVRFNQAATSILGLSDEEMTGPKTLGSRWTAVQEDGSPFTEQSFPAMAALRTGKNASGVLMGIKLPDGGLRWISVNASPFTARVSAANRLDGVPPDRQVVMTFSDVTEIMATRAQLNKHFNLSPDLICVANMKAQFTRINPSFNRILGYSDEELLTQSFLEFIQPDDLPSTLDEVAKLSQGIATLHFENRYRPKSGEYRCLSWMAQPDKASATIYAIARDVTQLRQSEEGFRQIIAALNQTAIVAFTDANGVITEVNDNFCSISGYSREELIGQTHRLVNSGKHPKEFFANMWKTISSGLPWSGDIQNRRKNGEAYWVRSVIAPLMSADRKVSRYVAIRFDVTDQKKAEHSNEQISRQLKEAQSIAKIGSWSSDWENGEYIWSAEQYKVFDIDDGTMGEELYRQYRSRFHPDDIGPLDELIDRARKHGAGFVYDHRIICRDGTIRYLRIGSVTRDQSGKPVRLSGTCQDVTESVKVKEALDLERTKSLRNAKLASLGEMSAGIAHEINNPLAIIQGTVKVLQQFLGNPEKLATKLATIERATERIAKIVRSLKKFSGTANKSEHRPLDLQGIIKESLTLTDAKIKQYGVDIALNGKVSSPVVCDEIEIEQVFVNLINNAIDAVKDQSNRWIQIEVFENDQSIGARVRDSGPGITVDVQKKLFQPFFTTKPVGQGTGLGLSITKGILNEHHATIELVHSEPNTCFELRFPKLPA